MLWVYGYYQYFNSFSAGTESEFDVYIRQILTDEDGPHAQIVVFNLPIKLRSLEMK